MVAKKKKEMEESEERSSFHNCYDPELRLLIAWRIRNERSKLFPGIGGAKKCAEKFGVSQQQWSLYESGRRTPDDERLSELADLFKVTLKHMKTPPANWPEIRKQLLLQKRTREQLKRDVMDDFESADGIVPGAEDENEQEAAAAPENNDEPVVGGGKDAVDENEPSLPPLAVTVGSLIDQIIAVDKMHDKGEIPTPVFNFAMESISDDLLKLAARHNSSRER